MSSGSKTDSKLRIGVIGLGGADSVGYALCKELLKDSEILPSINKLYINSRKLDNVENYQLCELEKIINKNKGLIDRYYAKNADPNKLLIDSASYEQITKDTDLCILTLDAAPHDVSSRDQLFNHNIAELCKKGGIADSLKSYEGLVMVVTNPVDFNCYFLQKRTGLEPEQICGFNHIDTVRLREVLTRKINERQQGSSEIPFGEYVKEAIKSANKGIVCGRHDEMCVPIYSNLTYGNPPLFIADLLKDRKEDIHKEVIKYGNELRKRFGKTSYEVVDSLKEIIKSAVAANGEKFVMSMLHNESEVYVGQLAEFHKCENGIRARIVEKSVNMSESEREKFNEILHDTKIKIAMAEENSARNNGIPRFSTVETAIAFASPNSSDVNLSIAQDKGKIIKLNSEDKNEYYVNFLAANADGAISAVVNGDRLLNWRWNPDDANWSKSCDRKLDEIISAMALDSKKIYVGTKSGVRSFDLKGNALKRRDLKTIYSAEADNLNIYCGLENSIVCLNKETLAQEKEIKLGKKAEQIRVPLPGFIMFAANGELYALKNNAPVQLAAEVKYCFDAKQINDKLLVATIDNKEGASKGKAVLSLFDSNLQELSHSLIELPSQGSYECRQIAIDEKKIYLLNYDTVDCVLFESDQSKAGSAPLFSPSETISRADAPLTSIVIAKYLFKGGAK